MANQKIRSALRKRNVKQWQLAAKAGVSESTLIRWLRQELPEEKQRHLLNLIDAIYTLRK